MKTKKIISELLLLVLFSSLLGTLSIAMAQEAPTPLYKISLVAPTNNPARMQYAQLIEKELPKLGFQTELSLLSWYPLLYRMGAFDEVGTYAEGGMDMGLIGFNIDPTAHPAGTCNSLFGRESVPPYGYNMVYWSDDNRSGNVDIYNTMKVTEAHEYLTKTLRETDPAILTDLFKEYQKIHYDVQALSFVYTEYRLHPISKGLYGFDPLYYPITSCEDQWLTEDYPGSTDLVILANSATPNAFNTRIVRDVYNQYVAGPVQDALCGSTPSANVFLPEDIVKEDWMKERYHDVFGTSEHSELYPRVAKALGTFSTDKLTYTIEVRDDVYFHDGHQLDAWDVAFSYQTYIVPDVGAPGYSTMRVAWGDDDKAAKHGNYSFEVVDTNADNFYETIKFHFNDTFGPWVDYVQAAIFPEHILGDPVTHGFDTNGDFDPDTLWQVMPRNFNT
ncbi:MAG: ABC transporter substrate-binding protein, partial [Promethearchaeota archaeon]